MAQAKPQGVELVGADGLLNQLTKRVLETALKEEMADRLGYDKHDPVGRNHGNSRNGVRAESVLTEIGPVEIDLPRDTDASFAPQIQCRGLLRQRHGRLSDRARQDRRCPPRRPHHSVDDLELATLSWVHWFNTNRLHSSIGYLTSIEHEEAHYRQNNPGSSSCRENSLFTEPGAVH